MAFLDTTGLQQVWNIIKTKVNNLEINLNDHTHNYAGSLSAGGSAISANKLELNSTPGLSNCLQYFQTIEQTTGNDLPVDGTWFHIIKMNHGAGDSYYKRLLAFNFSNNDIYTNYAINNGQVHDWNKLLHSGNYGDYTVKKDGTGASGTWGINISGNAASASSVAWGNITSKPSTFAPSSHNHDDRYYTESEINSKLVPKTENSTNGIYSLYRALGNDYRGGSPVSYHRIALPQSTSWGMFLFRILIRENYNSGNAGEILIYANHSSTTEWNTFYAICIGNLSTNIKVYGSDKKYIYIAGNFAYSGLSVEELLVGDSAASVNLSNVTIDVVSALPATYQTATMYYGLHSGNYNSYAPSKTGIGASGTWDINITGSSTSCTGNAESATKLATARTLTIGSTGKTFDGNGNVSWTLAEIGAVAKAGDTMGGKLVANATSVATLGTSQIRNIWAGTADISEVENSLNEGDIYLQYEEV